MPNRPWYYCDIGPWARTKTRALPGQKPKRAHTERLLENLKDPREAIPHTGPALAARHVAAGDRKMRPNKKDMGQSDGQGTRYF